MYSSLSKLLQETQATAAKKLGALENAVAENYLEQDGCCEHLQDEATLQSFGSEGANAPQTSNEPMTGLREHKIW